MKKTIIIKSLIFLFLISCKDNSYRKKEYNISSFKEVIKDTISPIKGDHYGAKSISVKGNADDTIYVKFNNSFKFYLKGNIDTIISADYYGEGKVGFEFNPYKAKNGKLKIVFGI